MMSREQAAVRMRWWWNVLTLIIASVNQAATSITLMEAANRLRFSYRWRRGTS
jgi:hypothetical protein